MNCCNILECKECYGAQLLKNECCNTCEAVVLLYRIRNWQFDRSKFSQCDPGMIRIHGILYCKHLSNSIFKYQSNIIPITWFY